MNLSARILIISVTMCVLLSCNQAPARKGPSLTDAKNLPPESDLKNEIIIIWRDVHEDKLLNYELHPDNQLLVTLYRSGAQDKPLAEERLAMGVREADQARRLLWRLRPENDASAKKSLPIGCDYVTDRVATTGVAFSRENLSHLEMFSLPLPEECQSRAAQEARALLDDIIRSLPQSKISAQYAR
jgi:hypothetical protein